MRNHPIRTAFFAVASLLLLASTTGGVVADEEENRKLQGGGDGRPCKANKDRCRRTSRCCPGLECRSVQRYANKRRLLTENRCVAPDFRGPIGLKAYCSAKNKRCKQVCCRGLKCKIVKRIVGKHGQSKFEPRCVDPNDPVTEIRPPRFQRWTVQELFANRASHPFAIARGGNGNTEFGFREHKNEPYQNTAAAVIRGFRGGKRMVQVTVRLTADGEAAAELFDRIDDSHPGDFTSAGIGTRCVSDLDLEELREHRHHIDHLRTILRQARHFSFKQAEPMEPKGLVEITLHTATPKCDPDGTADERLIRAVLATIRELDMVHQVLIESLSPLSLQRIKMLEPDIHVSLLSGGLQFLPPEVVQQLANATSFQVLTDFDDNGLGLTWYEVESINFGGARVPSYADPTQYVTTALTVGATAVAIDYAMYENLPRETTMQLFGLIKSQGLFIITYLVASMTHTPIDDAKWDELAGFGADGILLSDVALGDRKQAPWVAPPP